MEFIDRIVSLPTTGILRLMLHMLPFVTTIFLVYSGILLGGAMLSVIYNVVAAQKRDDRFLHFSRDLMRLGQPGTVLSMMLGFLPLLCISFMYGIVLYSSHLQTPPLILFSALFWGLGMATLTIYLRTYDRLEKHRALHIMVGLAGTILLLVAYYIYCRATWLTLLPYGERIAGSTGPEINSLLYMLHHLALAFLATGCAALFYILYWAETKRDFAADYSQMVTDLGCRITLVSAILQILLWGAWLFTSAGPPRFIDNAGSMGFLILLVLAIIILLHRYDLRFTMTLFIMMVLVFTTVTVDWSVNMRRALMNHTRKLTAMAEQARVRLAGTARVKVVYSGAEIFRETCANCHAYDRVVTGPPFNRALPRFRGKLNALEDFIDNPRRVDRAYPPMPRPPLVYDQIQAVAQYLLTDYIREHEKGSGTPAGEPPGAKH